MLGIPKRKKKKNVMEEEKKGEKEKKVWGEGLKKKQKKTEN